MTQIQLLQVFRWELWQLAPEIVEAGTEASQRFQLGPIHLSSVLDRDSPIGLLQSPICWVV